METNIYSSFPTGQFHTNGYMREMKMVDIKMVGASYFM